MLWLSLIPLLAALWTGFVLAISFMEAWLKFQAPGVTKAIGLSIGRLVFKALNLAEWTILVTIVIGLLKVGFTKQPQLSYIFILFIILLVQTFFFLPKLSKRARLVIQKQRLPNSLLHLWFITFEVIKVFLLICLSLSSISAPLI